MKKYYKFELNITALSALSLILLIVFVGADFMIRNNYDAFATGYGMRWFLLAYLVYIVLHEICHGIGFTLFVKNKKNVKYGAALEKGVLYAMCQERISKTGIIISLLFPIIFLTIITLIIAILCNFYLLELLSLVNLASAVGDLALLGLIIKLPKDVKYIDYDNVIGAYLISENDLSKYKSLMVKYVECGEDKEELVNKNIKFITISKQSWLYLIVILVIGVISAMI